jgi:hypothetical protein
MFGEEPLAVGDELLVDGDGLARAPLRSIRGGQVASGGEGGGMVGAEEPRAVGEELLFDDDGLGGAPRRSVRGAKVASAKPLPCAPERRLKREGSDTATDLGLIS